MELLILNSGKELTAGQLFEKIWKDDESTPEGVVWMYICYLRSKLEAVAANVTIIGGREGPFSLKEREAL